jgi:putative transposase
MTATAGAHPEAERVELWFADEARVGQKGRVTRVWYERGVRPRAVHDLGFSSVYLFGAVCPEPDAGAALVLPEVSTRAMALMLAEISRVRPPRTHAVVVLDRAGWHTSDDLEVPPNLTLVPLPAYSPELNPVEKVWQYLRDRQLSHRLFRDLGAGVDACCAAWHRLLAEPGRLRSLTAFPWLPPCVSSS